MKNLEEFYREVIDKIFPSFSEEHRKHLNLMFREKTSEWLTQKRQEKVVKFKYTWEVPMINIDELLEELKQ